MQRAVNVLLLQFKKRSDKWFVEYISRSTDGGLTLRMLKFLITSLNPSRFRISNRISGEIILESTSGGAGKIVPYWCEQGPVNGGRYQAWSAGRCFRYKPLWRFSCSKDSGTVLPLVNRDMFENFPVPITGRKSILSAYNIGSGSVKDLTHGQLLRNKSVSITYQFPAAPAKYIYYFDNALYAMVRRNIKYWFTYHWNFIEQWLNLYNTSEIMGGLNANAGP